jgi:hypothetical protein
LAATDLTDGKGDDFLYMNIESALSLYNPGGGLRGLGADINFDALFSKGLDVAGSLLARQASPYVSPDDPRYKGQYQVPPQQVMYPISRTVADAGPVKTTMTNAGGLNISTNTLILGGLVFLAFMLGKR